MKPDVPLVLEDHAKRLVERFVPKLTGFDANVYETFTAGDYLLDSEVGRIMLWSKAFPRGRKIRSEERR